jgi:inhibitor of KinA sporulation pathway (predicted exonuclease)
MNVTFLDLEMNQPSNLVIMIGEVAVNLKSGDIKYRWSQVCNPGELPSKEITDLTGITSEEVTAAPTFATVVTEFWQWFSANGTGHRLWAWGNDFHVLAQQSIAAGVPVPKLYSFNFKWFANVFRDASGGKPKGGLANALNHFGMKFVGQQHNALCDAENTARLAAELYSHIKTLYEIRRMFGQPGIRSKK